MELLRGPEDWSQYAQQVLQQNGVSCDAVTWGAGPQKYPCLAAATLSSQNKLISCYVYFKDAVKLVEACGYEVLEQEDLPTVDESEMQHQRLERDKHVNAMLLTLAQELIEVGATTKDRFEQKLALKLAEVDQWQQSEQDALLQGLEDRKTPEE